MPVAAAEAASKAVAAALRKPKLSKQASDARSAGPTDESLQEDLDQALAQGPQTEQQQVSAPAANGDKEETSEQRRAPVSKPSQGTMPVSSEQPPKDVSEPGSKPKKPPPGFESVNGVLKASSRAKKV